MIPIRDTIPHQRPPVVTILLILANLAVFLWETSLSERRMEQLVELCAIVPARYTHPDWARAERLPAGDFWPFLTSQFLHGSWLHVLSNVWTLWIFGDNVEDRLGMLRYLFFYVACGVAAGLIHFATQPDSTTPTLGASGAIAGVMGAYFVLYPRARVVALVPVLFWPLFLEFPAYFYLGFWFLLQLWSGTLESGRVASGGGIAWWAHVGGFLAGIALLAVFLRRRPARAP